MRAVAALWVLLYHFRPLYSGLLPGLRIFDPLVRSGFLGVEIFFVLSGFIISYNYAGSLSDSCARRRYLIARLARIYPVHVFTICVCAIGSAGAAVVGVVSEVSERPSIYQYLGNFLMLQGLPGFTGVNVPSWSITCELAAYILFIPASAVIVRLSGQWAGWLAAGALVIEIAIMKILAVYRDFVPTDYPEMWTRISLEFSAGVFVWCWWRRGRPGRGWDLVAVSSLVAIGALCWFVREEESPRAYLALPFIAMFIVAAASSTRYVKEVLSHPVTVWVGRVSYSLYMTHYIVWNVFDKFDLTGRMSERPLGERAGALMVVCVTVVLVAAFTYYVVEEPARRVVQRFAARSKARPVFPGRDRMSHDLR